MLIMAGYKPHPASEKFGLRVLPPRTNINGDQMTAEAYRRFKKALGLPEFVPPSDTERNMFDNAFLDPKVDFEIFLQNISAKGGQRD